MADVNRRRGRPATMRGDMRLTACALLLELAHADGELSVEECRHLQRAVRQQFGLGESDAARLLDLAEEVRAEVVDVAQLTRLIAAEYSADQKTVLARIMRGLVRADGFVADKEDYLMRKIGSLLRFEPGWV